MIERVMDKLAASVHDLADKGTGVQEPPLQRRFAIASAINLTVDPQLVTVNLSGSGSVDVPCLVSYVPQVGDKVLLLQEGRNLVAIGTEFAQTGWQNITLSNHWVNFGGSYQTAQFRVIGKRVVLRGLIANATDVTEVIATITPVPLKTDLHVVIGSTGGGGEAAHRIDTHNSGTLTIANATGTCTYISLKNIEYYTD